MEKPSVDSYFKDQKLWSSELNQCRALLLKTELKEELKWNMPCYTYGGKPVVGISGFKNHYGLWFYQGVFLKDPKKVLVNAQKGKTKAMRHLKFSNEIPLDLGLIKTYVNEAVENAKSNKFLKPEKKALVIPQLIKELFKENIDLKSNFEKFNLSDRRDFAEYITSAKRESTKLNRLDKIKDMIAKGEALNDKYRKK